MKASDVSRFFGKTRRQGSCLIWIGGVSKGAGYGNFWLDGRTRSAHHAAWFIANGWWPEYLCHTCDTMLCVEETHLFECTPMENTIDMCRKERVYAPKMTKMLVLEIRAKYRTGVTQAALAREYGLTSGYVSRLVRGLAWRYVS